MMGKKKALVPRLRFPEFRDAGRWEMVQLKQLGELISGLTYSPDDIREEGLLVLRSSNIQDGVISLEDNVYVKPTIRGVNLTKPNDILICVRNGSKPLIGKNALIPEGLPYSTHGAFMTVFRSKCANFIYQLFQTTAYKRQVAADLGATINSINGKHLKNYEFSIPKSEKEQQKISDCLSSLDTMIAAQAGKIDTLKIHKNGLMQQLFPREGETSPRLRFPEFRDAGKWKLRRLATFVNERNEYPKEKLPLYSLTIEYGIAPKTERYERSFLVKNEVDAYKLVQPEDFAYNPMNLRFGAIARHAGSESVAVSKYYNIFYCDDSVDSRFCEIYFRSSGMIKHYNNFASGSLIEKRRVHFSDFLKFDIRFPSLKEQQIIADCLSSLDELIAAQVEKLEVLKTHKRGLMQQLFPSPETVAV